MPADGLLDIDLAYGRRGLRISLPAGRTTVAAPACHPGAPDVPAALRDALRHPVAGPPLRAVVRPGQKVAVSVCDVTRPQPREAMLRALLDELDGFPDHGSFRAELAAAPDPEGLLASIAARTRTVPDQWQVLAWVLRRARVGVHAAGLTGADLRSAHLFAVPDIAAAVAVELAAAGPQARVCVLPEGPQPIPFVSADVAGSLV